MVSQVCCRRGLTPASTGAGMTFIKIQQKPLSKLGFARAILVTYSFRTRDRKSYDKVFAIKFQLRRSSGDLRIASIITTPTIGRFSPMRTENIQLEKKNFIATIMLNRPE